MNTKNSFLMFNIMRIRPSENEYWFGRIYVDIQDENQKDWLCAIKNQDRAKEMLLARIQKYLSTALGWKSICFASTDYNWGDFFMDTLPSKYGLLFEDEHHIPPGNIIGVVDLVVNQDELLAPTDVPAHLSFYKKGICIGTYSCSVDFQDGGIYCEEDQVYEYNKQADCAFVNFAQSNDSIPCDKDEDFMRLKGV